MNASVPELLFDNYPKLANELLAPMLDWMVAVRTGFGGDLDLFIIFLLIALRTVEDPRTAAINPHAVRRGEVDRYPSLFTNVRSIAASTGIPYETARRKVAKLIKSGWVERQGDYLTVTVSGSFHFRDMREKLFEMAAGNHELVAGLLQSARAAR